VEYIASTSQNCPATRGPPRVRRGVSRLRIAYT
jgi:hypothetical protein